ncbi:hypothetical protein [Nocardia salmonicida]|uniref:hypothetical protein n=1 Tax=Nocardia salmonicida TaxID=53431 RepID=UPI0033ED9F79
MTDYAAVHAMKRAIADSVAVLTTVTTDGATRPGTSAAALDLLIAVDDAFSGVDDLVERIPALLDAAEAGPSVAHALDRKRTALIAAAADVAKARRTLDELSETEAELVAASAEHEAISRRSRELDRLRSLARELPALRAQQQTLAGRDAALIAAADHTEQTLLDVAEHVIELTVAQQRLLRERTSMALEELRTLEAVWGEVNDAYQLAQAKVATLRAEHQARTAELAAHRAVDQDLLARLSRVADSDVLNGVDETLSTAHVLLASADEGLSAALTRYDKIKATARTELPWTEPS